MRRFYSLLLCCMWVLCAQAHEHYVVQHYSIKDGLSQNTVMAILQDRQGFMWFGTWEGLNRFDGYTFKVYKAMNNGVEAHVNNRVDIIFEDESERIWWGTYDGHFYRLDAARKVTTEQPYDSLPEGMLSKMSEADKNTKVDSSYVTVLVNGSASLLLWIAGTQDGFVSISSCWKISKDVLGLTRPAEDGAIMTTKRMSWSIR